MLRFLTSSLFSFKVAHSYTENKFDPAVKVTQLSSSEFMWLKRNNKSICKAFSEILRSIILILFKSRFSPDLGHGTVKV